MILFDGLFSDHPELLAFGIFIIGMGVARWGFTKIPMMRLVARTVMFVTFTYFLFRAHQVPYTPSPAPRDTLSQFLGDSLKAIWWFWAASLGSDTFRAFAFRGSTLGGQKLFQDLCVAGIYLCALAGLVTFVLNFPVQGVLVTSGAVAVVLGLALQSSLGDVFYGIVLSLGKPYGRGDTIKIDDGAEGVVLEMNWRATHLLTSDRDVVIIPNSVIEKSKIINTSFPSRLHGTTITVPLAANTSPSMAMQVLSEAALGCPTVLVRPPPAVVIKSMSLEAIMAEITFFTADVATSPETQSQVYEKIFRCLGVAGMTLGSRTTSLKPDLANPPPNQTEAERLVVFTPVFKRLPPEERATIASAMVQESIEPGKTVLEPGAVSPAMYVVGSGVLSITNEMDVEITRLGVTDQFGAAGLLGKAPMSVRVRTLTRTVLFRLEKGDLLRLVGQRPGFADDLSRELAARQSIAQHFLEQMDSKSSSEESLAHWFSQHLRWGRRRTFSGET